MEEKRIYLDANASYGLVPYAREALLRLCKEDIIANPSSIHRQGQKAKEILEFAREPILQLIEADPINYDLIFTSSATEANNTVFYSLLFHLYFNKKLNCNIITTKIEHPSIIKIANLLENLGVQIKYAKPSLSKTITSKDIEPLIDQNTVLVSIGAVNGESGIINDVLTITKEIKKKHSSILVHTDAAQAIGKTAFSLKDNQIDIITISGHKIGSPAGIGALIIKKNIEYYPILLGGSQEKNKRAGTENILLIAAFAAATQWFNKNNQEIIDKMESVKNIFSSSLENNDIELPFKFNNTLPNTLAIRIKGIPSNRFVVAADLEGISLSAGSACSSGKPIEEKSWQALGIDSQAAQEMVRISWRSDIIKEEVYTAIDKILTLTKMLKKK